MFHVTLDSESIFKLLELKDAGELFALVDKNRANLREWLPWLDHNKSVADSETFIKGCLEGYAAGSTMTAGIWHQGRFAGVASFHPINKANRKVSIGYWVGAEFRGKGLAKKATRALVNHAFNQLNLNRVELWCATGNFASQSVARGLGFKEEGVQRQAEWLYDHFVDHLMFAVLRDEWLRASN